MIILTFGLIFFFSGLIQSILGFGLGMISLPLLLMTGLNLPEAVLLVCMSSFCQTIIASYSLRKNIPWKEVIESVVIRSITIYLGVELLSRISNLPIDAVKQVFGVILLIIVLVKLLYKPKVHGNLWRGWSYIAFLLSGFMAGSFGIGGPPLVIWANSTTWEPKTIRAFLLTTFALSLPVMIFFMSTKFPNEFSSLITICLYTIPFVLAGIYLGLRIGNRVSIGIFNTLTFILLGLLSISFIVKLV